MSYQGYEKYEERRRKLGDRLVRTHPYSQIALGVTFYAYKVGVGFWWAVVYGAFWPAWLGWRIAGLLRLGE